MTRRAKKVNLSHDWLVFMMQSMNNWPDVIQLPNWHGSIPADAKVEVVYPNFDNRCLSVIVTHDSFPESPEGEELPYESLANRPAEMIVLERGSDGSFTDYRGQPRKLPTQIVNAEAPIDKMSVGKLMKLKQDIERELVKRLDINQPANA